VVVVFALAVGCSSVRYNLQGGDVEADQGGIDEDAASDPEDASRDGVSLMDDGGDDVLPIFDSGVFGGP